MAESAEKRVLCCLDEHKRDVCYCPTSATGESELQVLIKSVKTVYVDTTFEYYVMVIIIFILENNNKENQ